MESFEKLKELVQLAEAEVAKFDKGNKSAGTRARKYMQDIKNAAQQVRTDVQESKNAE